MKEVNLMRRIVIDLGSTNIRARCDNGATLEEPSRVAVESATRRVIAAGNKVEWLHGWSPSDVDTVSPMRDGVVADVPLAIALLSHCMGQMWPWYRLWKPAVTLCVSARSTDVQRQALKEAVHRAGGRHIKLMDTPLAVAWGAGLSLEEPVAQLVIHVGSSCTEVALLHLGAIIVRESRPIGGDSFDEAIYGHLREEPYLLDISLRAAEQLKRRLGTAVRQKKDDQTEVGGRDPVNGLLRHTTITSEEVRRAMAEPLRQLLDTVRALLMQIPPDLAADVARHGALLSGGGALLRGLGQFLSNATHIPVRLVKNPTECAVLGALKKG